jgi:hypothetical protein
MRGTLDPRFRLLHGPYEAPPLRRGARTTCLLRDCDVVITGWSDARISWPRCRAVGPTGGGSGLLLDEELADAVRHEAAAAICFWWGVSEGVVWRWRKALGVTRTNNEGSQRLIQAAAEQGSAAAKERGITDAECDERSRRALELGLARHLKTGYHGPRWTKAQLQLLGKEPDEVVAGKVGRTPNAVRVKREELGIPNPTAPRGARGRPRWTAAEDELAYRLPPAETARRTGRTLGAVYSRRHLLGAKRWQNP